MVLRGSNIKNQNIKTNFIFGGIAGTFSRTIVAPFDRIKILLQTTNSHQNIRNCYSDIIKKEGFYNLWKGNLLNCARVLPYSALQFGTYDLCKSNIYNKDILSVNERLLCGTIAGFTATTITHPVDVIRHRLMLNPDINSINKSVSNLMLENGYKSLFKGYGSTIISLTPFIAINFCTFDTLKTYTEWKSVYGILSIGALSALISQSICYPLDTVRRRMQISGNPYKNGYNAFFHIVHKEGIPKLYSGIIVNSLKIVPNNSIRFLSYELIRNYFDKSY